MTDKVGLPASGDRADVVSRLRAADDFLITCHGNPDGDAVGSLYGAAHLLAALGKRFTIYCPDPVPANLGHLKSPQAPVFEVPERRHANLLLLDCGKPDRVGSDFDRLRPFEHAIVVDHHVTERDFGDTAWVLPSASATGEMIAALAEDLGVQPDPTMAECLYTALYTDTGGFRFSNTTPALLHLAGRLTAAGARPAAVASAIHENQPLRRLRLLADVLSGLELHAGGRIGLIAVPLSMLERHGAERNDLDGFVDYPRSLAGVTVAVQIREAEPGRLCKVSLRSQPPFDVESVARGFGGGGHRQAAGCAIEGDLASVQTQVVARLTEALDAAGVRPQVVGGEDA